MASRYTAIQTSEKFLSNLLAPAMSSTAFACVGKMRQGFFAAIKRGRQAVKSVSFIIPSPCQDSITLLLLLLLPFFYGLRWSLICPFQKETGDGEQNDWLFKKRSAFLWRFLCSLDHKRTECVSFRFFFNEAHFRFRLSNNMAC